MNVIPYGKQDISQQDIDLVVDTLKSDFLTQGPRVPEFEKRICEVVSSNYAFAFNSATSALHSACLSLGVGKGDVVWTSPITFVASANCALYCNANVDFVDIDPNTFNLCAKKLEEKLEHTIANGKQIPKVVIPVHMCGQSCDMESIYRLSKKYGFLIIEDASHAIGASYKEKPVGNCQYSDITIFSFHPVKIITTAEGGVATTNNSELAAKLALFRSHGITRDVNLMLSEPHGPWYYEQIELGYNYRMTELQAALGLSQLMRLKDFVGKRNKLANRYRKLLDGLPILHPKIISDSYSSWHLYVIRLDFGLISKTHKEVFEALRERGLGVNVHYIPVHTQPYYYSLGFRQGQYPVAEAYYRHAISIPLFHQLTLLEQDFVIDTLKEVLV